MKLSSTDGRRQRNFDKDPSGGQPSDPVPCGTRNPANYKRSRLGCREEIALAPYRWVASVYRDGVQDFVEFWFENAQTPAKHYKDDVYII